MVGYKGLILLAIASVLGAPTDPERLEVSVVVAGGPGAGKTSIINDFCSGNPTKTSNSCVRTINLGPSNIDVDVYLYELHAVPSDSMSSQRTSYQISSDAPTADAALFVVDVTDAYSYQTLGDLIEQVHQAYQPTARLVMAHKVDHSEPKVDVRTIEDFGLRMKMEVRETSAKLSSGILESIYWVVRKIVRDRRVGDRSDETPTQTGTPPRGKRTKRLKALRGYSEPVAVPRMSKRIWGNPWARPL